MNIDRYINEEGTYRCFSVNNLLVSRHGMAKIAAKVPGVAITKRPRFFDDVVFCEFTLNGHSFTIEEPYGDSSTYDVVAPESGLKEMELVASHFEAVSPIKGGDIGFYIFSIINMLVGSLVLLAVVKFIAGCVAG